ncbi:inactive transglutaminase family protein [Alkalimarinus coralli]|uniref:inactive transglutaminase family protein n=1 Tax=Alkalimarinus coralli TaxID=2935863 RepID=UPI00202B8DB0|nr:inactive transglutaminase family protein [Alkalimarinus coralli]
MNKVVVRVWALLLAILGLGIAAYKIYYMGLPITPQQSAEVWTVQARLVFQGQGGPAKVGFHVPDVTPGFIKLDEDFISSRFGLVIDKSQDNRRADWSVRRAKGEQALYYRVIVSRSEQEQGWNSVPRYPTPPQYEEPYASAIHAILDDVRKESADVGSYTRELLQQLNAKQPNENVKLIRDRAGKGDSWVEQIIEILKGVRIPSRVLWGLRVSDASNSAVLEPLLQVHNGQKWLTYDPESGAMGIPSNFLAWKIGNQPLFELEGGKKAKLEFSITKTYEELIDIARQGAVQMDSVFADFSLLTLPVQNQNVYRLLLMVPLGALLVVFLRTFVGLKTFGTFMPILIALAFRETQLYWGLFLFTVIVSLGLMIRFYLERMMLLLIPRLASILVIVVILMVLISLISTKFGAERVLSLTLFPMVILAMTIERMSIVWEENGAKEAMLQGLGSMFVACLGYIVMTNEQLMYAMFVFPELLLVVLSLCLLMGRYTGYRLSELRRFRAIVAEDK